MQGNFSNSSNKSWGIQLLLLLALMMAGLLLSAGGFILIKQLSFVKQHMYLENVLSLFLSSVSIFFISTWIWAKWVYGDVQIALQLKRPENPLFLIIAFFLVFVSLPLVQYTGFLNQQIPLPQSLIDREKQTAELLEMILGQNNIWKILVNIVLIGVLPAIVEEMFFRGAFQQIIYKATCRIWLSIIITAFVFSFFHFQFLGFIPRLLLGIFLGALFYYSKSLLPSILFHATFNTFQLVLYYSLHIDFDKIPEGKQYANHLLIFALISAICTYLLIRHLKKISV